MLIIAFAMLPFAWTDTPVVEPQPLPPLEGALWEGEMRIEIDGSLFTQYLANRRVADSNLPGYMKEKGEVQLNYSLVIRFQVDSLGEFSMIAADHLTARRQMRREFRYKFKEEIELKGNLKVDQTVQVSEVTLENVPFAAQHDYRREDLPGSLRFLPSGSLDEKGSLNVKGDLTLSFDAKGVRIFTKARQPISEADANVQKKAHIKRSLEIPLQFEMSVALRQEPVRGSLSVNAAFTNPFALDDDDHRQRSIFTDRTTVSGHFQMNPLFTEP